MLYYIVLYAQICASIDAALNDPEHAKIKHQAAEVCVTLLFAYLIILYIYL